MVINPYNVCANSLEGNRIVLDCSHGATYRVAPDTFTELGADVTTLFDAPDGRNINLNCGSQHPAALAEEVVRTKADVGFAFDGDGDRLIAVDETGILTGDQILAVCAGVLKKEGALTNNLVVRTVMSNIGLSVAFQSLGIDSVMTKVGDRYVLEEMLARGAAIGGEDSGHLLFLEHHTTGDGIITALQVAAAMKKEGKPLSELAKVMQVFPQVLLNIEVKSRPEIETVPEIMAAIREVERQLGDQGRVLVRYSGTQNLCRVMVEGPTREETEAHCRRILAVVDKAAERLSRASLLQQGRFFPVHPPGQRLRHGLLPVRLDAQADAAVRADLARNGDQLVGDAPLLEDLFRLQDMADRGKQKNDIGRRFHQGRTSRAAPAIVSRMSYMLEMRPAAI